MNITRIELAKLNVPLVTPFKTALRVVEHICDVVVIIHTDNGHKGYGSAPATAVITGDTLGSIQCAINDFIAPQLVGKSIESLNQLIALVQGAMVQNTSAKAAVEMALYDLFAQWHQVPLYKILGGGSAQLYTDITISVDSIDKMVADTRIALSKGYKTIKVKIGNSINLDIERVKAIYAECNGKAQIRLDVNQGWTAKQTAFALNTLEQSGVALELVEQPVKSDDLTGLKYVTDRVYTPIMADESCFGPKEVIGLLQTHTVDIINIKLMKTGGISKAIQIADLCALYHIECMMGCMLESSIGAAAAAHVAASRANVITKIDLDSPALGQFDPVRGGTDFNCASIVLNDTPGLGIETIEGLEVL